MSDIIALDHAGGIDKPQLESILRALFYNGIIKGFFYKEAVVDVASIDDGNEAANEITVNGVALGDLVIGISCSIDIIDLGLEAHVTATNTVTMVTSNNTGGTLNLGSATFRIWGIDLT